MTEQKQRVRLHQHGTAMIGVPKVSLDEIETEKEGIEQCPVFCK